MFEALRKLFRSEKCPHCGKTLTELRVRLKPGEVESGPYYRCHHCGHRYLTEAGALVQAGPSPKPGEPVDFGVAAKPPNKP
jgi:DNA-directed RNA polymerase subunit RPC12/RpoP